MSKQLVLDQAQGKQLGLDANETTVLNRELTHLESKIYETLLTELRYRDVVPVSHAGGPGMRNINYEQVTGIGQAAIITHKSQDIPDSSFFVQEFTIKVRLIAGKFSVTTQEIRASVNTNVPISDTKASSMRRGIRQLESTIALQGVANNAITGLFGNTNVTMLTASTAATGSLTVWDANKTNVEILNDVNAIVNKVVDQSKNRHAADTLLLTPQNRKVLSQRVLTSTSTTLLDHIVNNPEGYGITQILAIEEMKDAFLPDAVWSGNGMAAYEKNEDNLALYIPMEMRLLPPQAVNLNINVIAEVEIAGTVVRRPLSMCFMQGVQ